MTSRQPTARIRVSYLRNKGIYYTVIGRNPPITRSDVTNAVRSRKFDAVLLTRVVEAETETRLRDSAPDAEATARGGSLINLFRYDYTELNEPARVDLSTGVTLAPSPSTSRMGSLARSSKWTVTFEASPTRTLVTFETGASTWVIAR